MRQALVLGLAYLLGSIPSGYLVARARGIDIRRVGSGNIGATNVFRVLGRTAGVLVLVADMLKGAIAVWVLPSWAGAAGVEAGGWLPVGVGLTAVLGHTFSCWLGFKGGKGIATTGGVYLALATQALLVTLALWGLVLALTRYVSVASIAAAVGLPLSVWLFGGTPLLVGVTALIGALAIYKHKGNIGRLWAGTENRMGRRKEGSA